MSILDYLTQLEGHIMAFIDQQFTNFDIRIEYKLQQIYRTRVRHQLLYTNHVSKTLLTIKIVSWQFLYQHTIL